MKRIDGMARLIIVALIWTLLPSRAMSAQTEIRSVQSIGGAFNFGIAGLNAGQQGLGVLGLHNLLTSLPGSNAIPLAPATFRVQGPQDLISHAQAQAPVGTASFLTYAGAAASPELASKIDTHLRTVDVDGHPGLGARTADALAAAVKGLAPQAAQAALDSAGYDAARLREYFDGGVDKGEAPVATFAEAARTSDADLKVSVVHHEGVGDFVEIPPGTFLMGSPKDEKGRYSDETQHFVTMTKPYQIAKDAVTQELYEEIMGKNPSRFKGKKHPVETVSYNDAQEFIRRLNKKTGKYFRLLTEAEWERAARAGELGSRHGSVDEVAWYDGNSGGTTHEVGGNKPNKWGIRDMLGNVYEWTQDRYGDYPAGDAIDPRGPATGSRPVVRGGSWYDSGGSARSAARISAVPGNRDDGLGLRLAH
jgi:formylglycine-generating enzyme required for sulfatase activity